MLKLIVGLAVLTFMSACTTTTTVAVDPRPGTVVLGAGAAVPVLRSSDPAMNSIYLPGGP